MSGNQGKNHPLARARRRAATGEVPKTTSMTRAEIDQMMAEDRKNRVHGHMIEVQSRKVLDPRRNKLNLKRGLDAEITQEEIDSLDAPLTIEEEEELGE
jgi:hypothetical protein